MLTMPTTEELRATALDELQVEIYADYRARCTREREHAREKLRLLQLVRQYSHGAVVALRSEIGRAKDAFVRLGVTLGMAPGAGASAE